MSCHSGANSKAHWIMRVEGAHGIELLFAPGWILRAASPSIWTDRNISAPDHIGKSLQDYPFLRRALPSLDAVGLFECRVRGLKLTLEVTYSGQTNLRDLDLWPVLTDDAGVMVHAAAYKRRTSALVGQRDRVRLIDVNILDFQTPASLEPSL